MANTKQYCNAGGSPYATIAILDMMDVIKCDISTVAFGMCASTATLLLVSVTAFVTARIAKKETPHVCGMYAYQPEGPLLCSFVSVAVYLIFCQPFKHL